MLVALWELFTLGLTTLTPETHTEEQKEQHRSCQRKHKKHADLKHVSDRKQDKNASSGWKH